MAETEVCPLCEREVPAGELRRHMEAELEEIRRYTIEIIRRMHPEWVARDGSCRECWEYYRSL